MSTRQQAVTTLTVLHLLPFLAPNKAQDWFEAAGLPTDHLDQILQALALAYPDYDGPLDAVGEALKMEGTFDKEAVQQEMRQLQASRSDPDQRPFARTACTPCQSPCAFGQLISATMSTAPGMIGGMITANVLFNAPALVAAARHLVNLNLPQHAGVRLEMPMLADLAYCLLSHCLGDEVRTSHLPGLIDLLRKYRDKLAE